MGGFCGVLGGNCLFGFLFVCCLVEFFGAAFVGLLLFLGFLET